MAAGGGDGMRSVEPVFLRQRDLPARQDSTVLGDLNRTDERYCALDICLAAERACGKETIHGAQEIRGLWRIYPLTREARNQLLLEGIELRGRSVSLYNRNPSILNENNGIEVPTTRLWISDLPISVDNDDIESVNPCASGLCFEVKVDHGKNEVERRNLDTVCNRETICVH
ncbi:hypothetical protein BaRGS_00023648 [Batillaria attramentaria]|uniref:Uncharacterized protein n=1 Tax=Batillaria attramentaria TaxID=370345 RepID=A0ABD0KD74_9CAEN